MEVTKLFEKPSTCWTTRDIALALNNTEDAAAIKQTERWIHETGLDFAQLDYASVCDEHQRPAKQLVAAQVIERARKKRNSVLFAAIHTFDNTPTLCANDGRGGRRWIVLEEPLTTSSIQDALTSLLSHEEKDTVVIPSGELVRFARELTRQWSSNTLELDQYKLRLALELFHHGRDDLHANVNPEQMLASEDHMTHLDRLEAESIHIIREVIAQADNPVMLYSVGKDSAVMLHLARKAFYPSPPPFPLLHVDTRWKFQAMYDFRDYMAAESGMDLLVHINPEGVEKNINPLDHGSALHTDIMKTQGLKQALDHYKFDVAFGGARRDEEKSRAKEQE